jgi:hypothetical protein
MLRSTRLSNHGNSRESTSRESIKQRACYRCEYCMLPEEHAYLPFDIDHIIAVKHGGATHANNLAMCCCYCNSYNGPNIAGIDQLTGRITPLYHPRRQKWNTHFRWKGGLLLGITAVGRTTIYVLEINRDDRVQYRHSLMKLGLFD